MRFLSRASVVGAVQTACRLSALAKDTGVATGNRPSVGFDISLPGAAFHRASRFSRDEPVGRVRGIVSRAVA